MQSLCSLERESPFQSAWGCGGEHKPVALLPSNTRTDVLWGLNPLLKKVQSLSLLGGGGGGSSESRKLVERQRKKQGEMLGGSNICSTETRADVNHPRGMKRAGDLLLLKENISWRCSILSLSICLSGYVSRYPFQVGYSCPAHPHKESG